MAYSFKKGHLTISCPMSLYNSATGMANLFLNVSDLLDSAEMASPLKGRFQPDLDDFFGRLRIGLSSGKAKNIDIVMQPAQPSRVLIKAYSSPDPGKFVGHDGHADPGAANQDTPGKFS
jgi:hypothetical protein